MPCVVLGETFYFNGHGRTDRGYQREWGGGEADGACGRGTHYTHDMLLNCALETYWLLLINVTPIIFNSKQKDIIGRISTSSMGSED